MQTKPFALEKTSLPLAIPLLLLLCLVAPGSRLCAQAPKPAAAAANNSANIAFAAAETAFKGGKSKDAQVAFTAFIAKYPFDPRLPDALWMKALCELKLPAQEGAAINSFNTVLTRYGESDAAARSLEQLASYYTSKKQVTQVAACREKLLNKFPQNAATARVWTASANALFTAGKFAEAVKEYEKVEKLLDAQSAANLKMARMQASAGADPKKLLEEAGQRLQNGAITDAIMLYERYLRDFPKGQGLGEAKCRLGWCLYINKKQGDKKDDYDRAEKLWKEVIAQGLLKDPWVGESQWHLVQLLAGPRFKWEEAVKQCDLLAKTFPGEFRQEQALFSKAWLFCAHQQWAASRAAFDELIKAFPDKAKHPPIVEYIERCDKNLATGKKGGA